MEKVFFDTNVYNHLTSKQTIELKALVTKGTIEIFTTPQVLGELAATLESDLEKGKELCKKYSGLISSKIINQPPILLLNEIKFILTGRKHSVFMNSEERDELLEVLNDLKNGVLSNGTRKFIRYYANQKKEHFKHNRESKKQLDPLWNKEEVSKYPDFKAFWIKAFETGDVRRQIKDYLNKLVDKKLVPFDIFRNITGISKKLEKNLYKLPHLETAIKIIPAMSYRYHLQKRKAKHGDLEDTTNLIATATLDIYVSDDAGAREVFSLIFPDKISLSLNDFYASHSSINPR